MTGKGTGDRSIPAWSWSLTAAASSLGVSARKNGTHPELACAAVRPIVRAAHQVSVSLSQTAQRWSHAVSMAAAMVLAEVPLMGLQVAGTGRLRAAWMRRVGAGFQIA
jgi:hypothetical protein